MRYGWWPWQLISTPTQVARRLWEMALSRERELLMHTALSLQRVLGGFAIGSTLGILVGAMVGLSRKWERVLAPTMQALAPVPPVAWIPLIIVIFGIGEESKIALIAAGAFSVLYVNTFRGFRSADESLVEVGTLFRWSPRQLAWRILFPSAAPSIFTGMRVALGLSWILLFAAEFVAHSRYGLGWLIRDARNFSRPDDMMVGMFMIGLLGKLSDSLMARLEDYAFRWQRRFSGR
ncbi:ABC transporter permease [Candidatus Bipolaricaulota bacterium]|nr:ABC transporter permease [Candidatus Bipolaricaulota bacterium]